MDDRPVTRSGTAPAPLSAWARVEQFGETWGRLLVSGVAILAQLAALVALVVLVARVSPYIALFAYAFGLIVLVGLLNSHAPLPYKLAWTVPVLALPLIGPLMYVLFAGNPVLPRWGKRRAEIRERATSALGLVPVATMPHDGKVRRQVEYIHSNDYVPRADTRTTYHPEGSVGFDAMLAAVAEAERYVFCEFFILASGQMFEKLFAALAERAAAGVEVRVLYDDLGSVFRRPRRLAARCHAAGIQVHPVNPLGLGLTLRYNNRDHRKILVVDGTTAFTGGINIGDEYINLTNRFGHWKDNVIELRGPGAWSLTVMFTEMWSLATRTPADYEALLPSEGATSGSGLVIPFADTPFDDVPLSLAAYRHLLSTAHHSVDIVTPYLVIDDDLSALIVETSESGVRVRIVTPAKSDTRLVQQVGRSYYDLLVHHGVELYEYSPGFVHSKIVTADDDLAIVGTINFDYRSFYLHNEDGVWLWQADCLPALHRDVESIFAASRRITEQEVDAVRLPTRVLRAVLRTFAPLM